MNSIIEVVTPASSYDLTTVEAVRIELKKSSLTSDEIQLIQSQISGGSVLIANYCNRVFPREVVIETFWPDRDALHPRDGGGWPRQFWTGGYSPGSNVERLYLNRYPIVEISSIVEDDDELDVTDYRIDNKAGFVYRLDKSGYSWNWAFGKSIIVNYSGGYDPIPLDLQRAATLFCSDAWFNSGQSTLIRSETIYGIASTTYFGGGTSGSTSGGPVGGLTIDVLNALELYRRYPVG